MSENYVTTNNGIKTKYDILYAPMLDLVRGTLQAFIAEVDIM